MARIRSLHPGQWTDDSFVACSPLARLLTLGLRNEADDNGIFEWNPTKLKMRILPADNCDMGALLGEIEASGQVQRYHVNGREFGIIRNFKRFQKPKKPSYLHPLPEQVPDGLDVSKPPFPTSSPPVPNQSRTDSEKTSQMGSGSGSGGKAKPSRSSSVQCSNIPSAPSAAARASPAAFPEPQDERVTALHALCLGSGVIVPILHARQWAADGVSEPQMRAAIERGKQRKPGQSLNAGFLSLMLQDVRASPAGYDLDAEIKKAMSNLAAKESANASH